MDEHTTTLESFVEGSQESLFSIYNLPYGVFSRNGVDTPCIGCAIGDYVLDLSLLESNHLLKNSLNTRLFNTGSLNEFASKGKQIWSEIRARIQQLLDIANNELQGQPALLEEALLPYHALRMLSPFKIGGFSDFYASEQHATNVGKLFRGNENALLPNWKYLPVGYNGRASTVFASGTPIKRPKGQIKFPDKEAPLFNPTNKLDFELELGIFIGKGNPDGHPIAVQNARSHIFGLVLLNDWSARDIQAFEYQPLGPFLSKSFATSISPWVVPLQAIEEAMTPLATQIPRPVDYLYEECPKQPDIKLSVAIKPRGSNTKTIVCETSSKTLYWSMEQMLAHHTVNHCIMSPGDLLGTGTISGPEKSNWGSLLELTLNGKEPIQLDDGSERRFLEDGDTVIFTGYCETSKGKIGFGSLEGVITPADK